MKQQGDVLYEKVKDLPQNLTPVKKTPRGFVLAEGEVTGHAHVINADVDMWLDKSTGDLYFQNDEPVHLDHEEHGTHIIEPGIYRSWHVQEYDHFAEEAKNVQD